MKGIKFRCYNAGHVLGAAMFLLEIDNMKVPSLALSQKLNMWMDLLSPILCPSQLSRPPLFVYV